MYCCHSGQERFRLAIRQASDCQLAVERSRTLIAPRGIASDP